MCSVPCVGVKCGQCEAVFHVCRCCWRGQGYCSDRCRDEGRREKHRQAQAKYRHSWGGRIVRAAAEKRRRARQKQRMAENVGDATSTPALKMDKVEKTQVKSVDQAVFCQICGRAGVVVPGFSRRGYGGKDGTHHGRVKPNDF